MGIELDGLQVIAPIGYLDMAQLLQHAAQVYTVSGGLQKEAYFHRVPCVTLGWPETVQHGWNRLWKGPEYDSRSAIGDYSDRRAAFKIADLLRASEFAA
jgi:UDP-GlcNAc3NAcA epimerase